MRRRAEKRTVPEPYEPISETYRRWREEQRRHAVNEPLLQEGSQR